VLSFFLSQVETVIDEAPTEVFNVELTVTVVIHCFEDFSDPLETTRGTLKNLGLDLFYQIFDGKGF
jgi:hypothetical protein